MIELIKLSSGYSIPQIGLGVFQTVGENVSDLIYKAIETGYRHFDSARYYHNEQDVTNGIAKYLKEHPEVKRSDIFYTTKLDSTFVKSYESAKSLVLESILKSKNIDYIDLFLIHSPTGGKEARLTLWKVLQEYVESGEIRSIGVSNFGIHHLQELLAWPELKIKPVVNQVELNPWLTRKDLVDYMRANGILPEAYSPLTRGWRLDDPELTALAKKYNKSNAQILIRWNLQMGYITLPKTASAHRLAPNLDVFDFELSPEDFKNLTHEDQYWVSYPDWDPCTFKD